MHGPSIDLKSRISRRVAGRPGAVWTPVDFLDLGSRDAVDKALQRLARAGELRRIDRGLYDRPQINRLTGQPTVPDYRAIIDAIARRDQAPMLVDGMTAANDLGLSDAVPGQVVAHTAARLRPVRLGNLTIRFRLTAPSKLYWAGRPAMRVVQALHWLRDTLSRPQDRDRVLRRLRAILADPKHGAAIAADLADGLPTLPAWMQGIMRELLAEDGAKKGQSEVQRSQRQAGGAVSSRTKNAPSAPTKRAMKATDTDSRLTQTSKAGRS